MSAAAAPRPDEEGEAARVPSKVREYEHFLNEKLCVDLRRLMQVRDELLDEQSEYERLAAVVESIQTHMPEHGVLKTRVDLGCNIYCRAKVRDCSKILVCIGFGFYLEMGLAEALEFIASKVPQLERRVAAITEQISGVQAMIKLVLEGLREVQGLS